MEDQRAAASEMRYSLDTLSADSAHEGLWGTVLGKW